MEWTLAIAAATLLGVAAMSRLLTGTPVTTAMVFTVVGLIFGPLVLGDIDPSTSSSTVRSLAEATLALVLFSDAARIDLGKLRQERALPVRLLGIGLPLTIVAGVVAFTRRNALSAVNLQSGPTPATTVPMRFLPRK